MKRHTLLRAVLTGLLLLGTGMAQSTSETPSSPTPAAAPAADPPATPASAWNVGPVAVSGMADGYYSFGFNHPANNVALLRNFDDRVNQPELNMAMMTLDMAPKPVGFHLDVGFGRAFDIMDATEKDVTPMRFFKQAYIDVKPASWHGAELDFGKFVTSAGAEVIETGSNFNYSRSLLFSWAIPYYHTGMRFSMPVTKQLTAGVQWVSGWNNIVTGSTYRTFGLTETWTRSKFAWTNTWYGGPDENTINRGYRNLYDTVLTVTPNSKTSFYVNFDYLHDKPKLGPAFHVTGIAGAAKFQLTRKLYLSPRLEWLNDAEGGSTGVAQKVKEGTLTANYAFESRLQGFLEYRHDWSDQPFFNRGNEPGTWKTQPTLLLGMLVLVKPRQ